MHINTHSLLPKSYMLRIWVCLTGANIVISETWLTKSFLDKDVSVDRFNGYCSDCQRKGCGVAINGKSSLETQLLFAQTVPKQFEILAFNINLHGGQSLTVLGCYRPPSATSETLINDVPTLMKLSK